MGRIQREYLASGARDSRGLWNSFTKPQTSNARLRI
jgi:hypothetical protein